MSQKNTYFRFSYKFFNSSIAFINRSHQNLVVFGTLNKMQEGNKDFVFQSMKKKCKERVRETIEAVTRKYERMKMKDAHTGLP